ncbi:probable membrane-associated kinase regulator 2 isoform X2 [Phoenix dactylifera]|uniref:Probable membrane-associated kinase regulator 2 isoform X2 n=1 Tax=Phoenix dactylifera TaxID=42345 RepID=A0A8B9AKG6_PHODC|nr:probable membrane-associated kinase regulator 2 isoform X2 [Phoenix dactylifera]
MESFSLLKYWRGGGGAALAAAAATAASSVCTAANAATTTIATSVLNPSAETDDDGGDVGDDGPFFDLEFAVPEEDGEGEEEDGGEEKDGSAAGMEAESDDNEEGEFNFMVSSEGSCGGDLRSDPLSPSDDLFFKGKLVPLEPSSIVITSSEADPRPQFAVSLLKSATKFRVFMLGLRKAKSTPAEPNGAPAAPSTAATASPKQQSRPQPSKFFIKFKVEEVPIISLFTRDNGSRNSSGSKAAKSQAEESAAAPSSAAAEDSAAAPPSAAAEEKKFSKEVVHKYLNKIKPLYVRVSKRYAQKLRFSGQLTPGEAAAAAAAKAGPNEGEETDVEAEAAAPPSAAPATTAGTAASGVKCQKVNLPTGLKVVCKRLGKSRSASAAVAAVPSPPPQRRDDSLLQQQDGIQSAIAHCKKSFNAAEGFCLFWWIWVRFGRVRVASGAIQERSMRWEVR